MEARLSRTALAVISLLATGASYRTDNFIINAPSAEFAQRVGDDAETLRKTLAMDWLGHELPTWPEPCPITVNIGGGAGGATSFVFDQGRVFGWRMSIQGSPVRILDSVLPHEVMHTVFASHFRRPLPRWADEGACTTVEHSSERAKQNVMLVRFLRTQQGIAFSRMFAMKNYPPNIMPLYSQGYSLARFLIAQGGRREFLAYLDDGMKTEQWSAATMKHYGYKDLGELQNVWLAWVAKGSPRLDRTTIASKEKRDDRSSVTVASAQGRTRPQPNLIYRTSGTGNRGTDRQKLVPIPPAEDYASVAPTTAAASAIALAAKNAEGLSASAGKDTWRPAGSRKGTRTNKSAGRSPSAVMSAARQKFSRANDSPTARTQVTRPQPIQQASQIVVQWNQPAGSTAAAMHRGQPTRSRGSDALETDTDGRSPKGPQSGFARPSIKFDGPLSSANQVIRR